MPLPFPPPRFAWLQDVRARWQTMKDYFASETGREHFENWTKLARAAMQGEHKFLDELRPPAIQPGLRHEELFRELVKAFLLGPVGLAAGDSKISIQRAVLREKVKRGQDLSESERSDLAQGIILQNGSALYGLSYRYQYDFFSAFTDDGSVMAPDGFLLYPPSWDVIETSADINTLYRSLEITELLSDLQASPPVSQQALQAGLLDNAAFDQFAKQTVELIRLVMGAVATEFLMAALKSIPEVDDYFRQVMPTANAPELTANEYVEVLLRAPAYLRVVVYVADANDRGHALDGARVPFPVETSDEIKVWIDTMLTQLFAERASENPFHSLQRQHFYEKHPLDVEAAHAGVLSVPQGG